MKRALHIILLFFLLLAGFTQRAEAAVTASTAVADSSRGKKDEVTRERVPGKKEGERHSNGSSENYSTDDSFIGTCIGDMVFSCCSEVFSSMLSAMFAPTRTDSAKSPFLTDSVPLPLTDSVYEAPLSVSPFFTDYISANSYITLGAGIRVPSMSVAEDYKNPLFALSLGNEWFIKGANLGIQVGYASGSATPAANFQTTITHPDNSRTIILDVPGRPSHKQFTLQLLAGYAFKLFMVDSYKAAYCNFGASAAYTSVSEKTGVRSSVTPPSGAVTVNSYSVEKSFSKVTPGGFLRFMLAGGQSVGILSFNYDYIGNKGNKKLSTPLDWSEYKSNLTIGLSIGVSIR